MSKLDLTILIGASVSISVFVGVLAAFYTGVYKPIKHNMSNVSGLNIKRDTGPLSGLHVDVDSGDGLQLDTYSPQVTYKYTDGAENPQKVGLNE